VRVEVGPNDVDAGEVPRSSNKPNAPPSNLRAKQVARLSAWLLLAAVAISVLSGWGITRTGIVYSASFGLVDRGLANAVHRGTQVPMALFFLVHILANAHAALHVKAARRQLIDAGLVILGIVILASVVYMEYWASG